MLSVFQLTDLVLYHTKSLQVGSLIQLKYLMLAHVFLIMMLIALFFFQDFHINILIAFLFCFVTSVTFTICEEALDALPSGNHRENFLIFHKLGKY